MNMAVTPYFLGTWAMGDGGFRRYGQLEFTAGDLAAGANVVPHGLPFTPTLYAFGTADAGVVWWETQPADATNVYITLNAGLLNYGWVDFIER